LKNHRVTFHKKIQSSKSKLPSKEPFGWNGRNNKVFCAALKNYEQLRMSS